MALTVGHVKSEAIITVHVPENYVMTAKKKRYVFLQHVKSQIYDTVRGAENRKLYQNYAKALRQGHYNVVTVYGLEAIDIDNPQNVRVSTRIRVVVHQADDYIPGATVEVLGTK